jgi:hypothetical protein
MGVARNLKRAWALPPRTWADLATAAAELALARIELAAGSAEGVVGDRAAGGGHESDPLIDRVAFAIPRMAARVPWKATCLVQALAARHWLARKGVPAAIRLGVRKPSGAVIDAHAWLEAGGRRVVGGETDDYAPFAPSRAD